MDRILLVDDDPGTLDIFQGVLCAEGFRVFTADSGQGALEYTRRVSLDVVLADLRLPDFSGVDLLRKFRAEGITASVIIMSGYATVSSAIEATRLGAIDYLEKPLSNGEVVEAVRKALNTSVFSGQTYETPAADRWASLVMAVVEAHSDPTTLADWATIAHISRATLILRCQAASLSPKVSLDFARMLRALVLAERLNCRADSLLECDPRTLTRLLRRASPNKASTGTNFPQASTFMKEQDFIHDLQALQAIQNGLQAIITLPILVSRDRL